MRFAPREQLALLEANVLCQAIRKPPDGQGLAVLDRRNLTTKRQVVLQRPLCQVRSLRQHDGRKQDLLFDSEVRLQLGRRYPVDLQRQV